MLSLSLVLCHVFYIAYQQIKKCTVFTLLNHKRLFSRGLLAMCILTTEPYSYGKQ